MLNVIAFLPHAYRRPPTRTFPVTCVQHAYTLLRKAAYGRTLPSRPSSS